MTQNSSHSLMRALMGAVGATAAEAPTSVKPPASMPPRTRTRRRVLPQYPVIAPERELQEFRRRPTRTAPVPEDDRHLDMPWGPDYFKNWLRRSDRTPEVSRVGTDYVHLSSLIDFCSRAHALAAGEGVLLDPPPTGGHRVMWKIGRAVEEHVRGGIITARDRQGCLGRWVCPCGAHTVLGLYEETACGNCGHSPTIYREMELFDHDAGIVGNPDFLCAVSWETLVALEIKSMKKEQWAELSAPLPDHVFQATGYNRLLKKEGYQTLGEVAFIYVTKDFKFGDPYKEFHINTEDELNNRILDMAWSEARDLKISRERGALPPRVKCQSVTQPRARNCPMAATCFQRSA